MIYIILALIISVVVNYFLIKSNIRKSIQVKNYKDNIDKIVTVEKKKEDIRNEYDDKKDEVITNNDIITDGVMPINATKHSGNFRNTKSKTD